MNDENHYSLKIPIPWRIDIYNNAPIVFPFSHYSLCYRQTRRDFLCQHSARIFEYTWQRKMCKISNYDNSSIFSNRKHINAIEKTAYWVACVRGLLGNLRKSVSHEVYENLNVKNQQRTKNNVVLVLVLLLLLLSLLLLSQSRLSTAWGRIIESSPAVIMGVVRNAQNNMSGGGTLLWN